MFFTIAYALWGTAAAALLLALGLGFKWNLRRINKELRGEFVATPQFRPPTPTPRVSSYHTTVSVPTSESLDTTSGEESPTGYVGDQGSGGLPEGIAQQVVADEVGGTEAPIEVPSLPAPAAPNLEETPTGYLEVPSLPAPVAPNLEETPTGYLEVPSSFEEDSTPLLPEDSEQPSVWLRFHNVQTSITIGS